MSYEFECRNVVPDCDFKTEAETKEQLMGTIAGHANEVHGKAQINPPAMAAVEAAIVEKSG